MSNARVRRKLMLRGIKDEIERRRSDGAIEGGRLLTCADGDMRWFPWIVTRDGRIFADYQSSTGRYPDLSRLVGRRAERIYGEDRHDLYRKYGL